MFIPVGLDEDEVRRAPWISYGIIGVNVVVFFAMWMGGADPGRFGFVPAEPRLTGMLTSMFVHGGLLHLAGNMVFFYLTGPLVEDAYGRVVFPFLYLLSGIVAASVHAAQNPGSQVPMIGASGAIAGIMGAFLVRYGRRRIQFLWMPLFPLPWLSRHISIRAFLYFPFWFALQLLMARLAPADSGVALWAHIGGFVFGALAAVIIEVTGVERRWIHPAIEARVGFQQNPDLVRAVEAGGRGETDEALRATNRAIAADPGNLDARRYAYEIALESKDLAGIARHAAWLLEAYTRAGDDGLALALVRETTEAAPSLPARFLLRAADVLAREKESARAIALYDRVASAHPNDPAALRALLQAALLRARSGAPERARQDLESARRHPSCTGDWVAAVERKAAELDTLAAGHGYPRRSPPPG